MVVAGASSTCTITSTDAVTNEQADESMRCEFATEVGGQYEITAIVTDDDGRSNRAVYTQWVSGSTARPTRDLTQGEVVIVPDADYWKLKYMPIRGRSFRPDRRGWHDHVYYDVATLERALATAVVEVAAVAWAIRPRWASSSCRF